MNYIVSAAMYGTAPLPTVLSEIRKTGSEFVDIWPMPHGNQREQIAELGLERSAQLMEKNGVRLGAITRYDLGPGQLNDEIKVLKKLGGKLLVTGAKRAAGATVKQQVRNFVESIKRDAAYAAENGVTIGIENHAQTPIHTPDSIRYFAEYVDFPNLGLAMAPYHLPQDPQTISALVADLDKKLVFFQAWEHGKGCMEKLPNEQELMQMPGRGNLDFEPIVAALKKCDYQGWTEIFMHPVPRGISIRETSEQVTKEIVQSQDYLARCLAEVSAS